jgi:hypothetical protein
MTDLEIQRLLDTFMDKREAESRYASFDYCFNYFHSFGRTERLRELAAGRNIEKSCLHLGFFLASWGMFRMSGKLGQGVNAKHFVRTINEISQWDDKHPFAQIWDVDVTDYNLPEKRLLLLKCYGKIKELVLPSGQVAYRTLVTKIMLGVFGCVPAFDSLFTETFRTLYGKENGCAFTNFNDRALQKVHDFYANHSSIIDRNAERTKTLDFQTGRITDSSYKRAKIIDMIGFQKAWNKAQRAKRKQEAQKKS